MGVRTGSSWLVACATALEAGGTLFGDREDLLLDILEVPGRLMVLAAPGVGLVVHCHWPLARAHAWPSLAVPYGEVAEIELPVGAKSSAWPLVLLSVSDVSLE